MCIFKTYYCRRRQLVSVEESWNLPMSTEIPARQQQNPHTQRNGATQGFQKNYPVQTIQGSSSAYHSSNGITAHKSFKTDHGKRSVSSACSYNVPQQHQVYNYFQQGVNILNCTNELGLMQHLHHQLRLQQNQQMNMMKNPTASEAQSLSNSGHTSTTLCIEENSTSQNSAHNLSPIRKCDKPIQPNPLDRTKNFTISLKDSGKKIEEDLKNIISQKNLATTITENFLRTFGSDDIDVKDTDSAGSFGKSY